MVGKRSRSGRSNAVNDNDKILDPAFATLDTILGPPGELPQLPEDELPNNGLLLTNLESGLSDQLVAAWATLGQTSVTSSSFIDATVRLKKLLNLMSWGRIFKAQGSHIIGLILDDHLKLIYRALHTQRPSSVIPTLQLLREIVSFERGLLADDTYFAFDFSLAVLPKLLVPPKQPRHLSAHIPGAEYSAKRGKSTPKSTRYYMIELLMAFWKSCSSNARADFLAHRKLIVPWLKNVATDDPEQLAELLDTLYIQAMDTTLPKSAKTSFFTDWVLGRILHICKVIHSLPKSHAPRLSVTFDLIINICTRTDCGVRFDDKGWYLPGALDNNEKRKSHRVHNRVLLAFSKMLDPNDSNQEQLLMAIFRSCPEIVAAYTSSNSLRIVSKPTAGFLKWFTLCSKIIALPVPEMLIDSSQVLQFPPAVDIVVENILPSPLTRSILESGMQSQSQLIRNFLLNLQVQALLKLQNVVSVYDIHGWISDKSALLEEIYRRLPDITTVACMTTFNTGYDFTLLVSKWLRLYAATFPDISATARVDLSARMMDIIVHIVPSDMSVETSVYLNNEIALVLEMRNLLFVQSIVPVPAKFWNKPDYRQYSLLTYLMVFATAVRDRDIFAEITGVLEKITSSTYLFQRDFPISPIHILIESLKAIMLNSSQQDSQTIWYLINEAIARCLRSPFKYIDQVKQFSREGCPYPSFSPLLAALVEQWEYLVKSNNQQVNGTAFVLRAILRIVVDFCLSGEDFRISKDLLLHLVMKEKPIEDTNYESEIQKYCGLPDLATAAIVANYGGPRSDGDILAFEPMCFIFPTAGSRPQKDASQVEPMISQLTDIGFSELFRLYRAAEYSVLQREDLPLVCRISQLLAIRLSRDLREAAMKYIRRKDCWRHLLWTPSDDNPSKLMFTKSFFAFVNLVMDKETTIKEELGFVYDYVLEMIPTARKSSRIMEHFIPGLALLDRDALLSILSNNVKYRKPHIAARICGEVISVLQIHFPSVLGELENVNELMELAFVSSDKKLALEVQRLLPSKGEIAFAFDIQLLGKVLISRQKDLYDLAAKVITVSNEAFSCVVENHADTVIALDRDSLFLFARAIAEHMVENDDKAAFYVRRADVVQIPVTAANILRECINHADVSRVEQDVAFFKKVVLVLSTEEDCALFYDHVAKKTSRTISELKITYTHAMYRHSVLTEHIRADANQYMKSVMARITRYLSESELLSATQLAIIVSAANFLAEFPRAFSFGKNVNPPIEAAIGRWISKFEVMQFAFSLMLTESDDLEYAKFLQMIAEKGETCLKDYPNIVSSPIRIQHACMIHYLYFLNPTAHVDSFLATRLMMLYSGTCGPSDRLLLQVLHRMDAHGSLNAAVKIALYSFVNEPNSMRVSLCKKAAEGLEILLSGKTFGSSIKHMLPDNFDYAPAVGRSISAYMEYCETKTFSNNPYAVYDPLFMLPAIMDMVSRKLVDIKLLTENHCIGYVIMCLGCGGSVNAMARRTLVQLIALYEVLLDAHCLAGCC
ncbi:ribosome 60S biogenesis N-terminal-domain-containing protein [Lipomyces orientalis]|uniref:Ribosome 60S biogenesis N-terminal-domain-containing protein n=1 Tax=Lipomyces orientalis TaxID=1233043 RepID=A0ACC3TM68_9ASCO